MAEVTNTWVTVYSRLVPGATCTVTATYNDQNGNLTGLTVNNQIAAPERVVARISWTTGQADTVVDPVPVGVNTLPRGQARKIEEAASWSLALIRD